MKNSAQKKRRTENHQGIGNCSRHENCGVAWKATKEKWGLARGKVILRSLMREIICQRELCVCRCGWNIKLISDDYRNYKLQLSWRVNCSWTECGLWQSMKIVIIALSFHCLQIWIICLITANNSANYFVVSTGKAFRWESSKTKTFSLVLKAHRRSRRITRLRHALRENSCNLKKIRRGAKALARFSSVLLRSFACVNHSRRVVLWLDLFFFSSIKYFIGYNNSPKWIPPFSVVDV